jgi:hypothetical protein
MERLVQQGDVLFFEIDELPLELKKCKNNNRVIFAEGEVTGHHHATTLGDIETYNDADGNMFADVKREKRVIHEEHGPVTLTPGKYQIGIVREIDPFSEEVREVAD